MKMAQVFLIVVVVILLVANMDVDVDAQSADGFIFLMNNDVVMKDIVNGIDTATKAIFTKAVKPDLIEKELDKVEYVVQEVDRGALEDEFVAGIEKLFKSKTNVLENIRTSAEDAEMAHDYAQQQEEGPYFNMRDIGVKYNINESIEIVNTFSESVKVNLTHSFVQVPTNVYAYKKSVLHQVEWAKRIDKSFVRNFNESNQTLLWQFFGDSATGIFRIYPGNIISVKDDETDLYDCRRRIWYIQSASSAKDIVIVLDISGSMIGNNIGIAKIAISSLIDTFQENDYFNIIMVNKEIKYTVPCIKYLIQATKENKEMMKHIVQNISEASQIIDVDKGMDEAFKILLHSGSEYNRTSAGCNQAIMFITDGIEGEYAGKESFQRNNKDKRVRVFSYLVGRVKNPDKKALVEMSCDNGGHFYHIETLGNIWDTVLDYLRVMSRPITEKFNENSKNIKPTYSPAYLDSAGFGMVMSISLSVFQKRKDAEENKVTYKEFLGVAGTDISLKNLRDQIELSKMGVFSRGFVINNNGFILIHPHFRDQTGYLPVPPNILMDELEYSNDVEAVTNLKTAMLDPTETADTAFKTLVLYDSNRKVYETPTEYTYQTIPDTDFVAAVAITDHDKKYLTVKSTMPGFDELIQAGIEALYAPVDTFDYVTNNMTKKNTTYTTIAPWNYCDITSHHTPDESDSNKPKGVKTYPTAGDLYEFLKNDIDVSDMYTYCSKELIDRLLVLAGSVNEGAKKAWEEIVENVDENVGSVFVATSSGYQKYHSFHNSTNASHPFPANVMRSQLFEEPTANPGIKYLFSAPVRDESKPMTNEPVLVTITKQYRKNGVLTAVSGAQLSSEYLNNLLIEKSTFLQSSITYRYCEDNNTAVCALIDDHGYIIASNQNNKYTGHFIGERLGGIIESLEKLLNFKKLVLDDTQAECPISDEPSSANFLLTPAKIIIGFVSALFNSAYWITVQLGIFLISLFEYGGQVGAEKPKTIRVSCTKEMPFYKTDMTQIEDEKLYKGKYNCPNCKNKNFIMRKLVDTNLIFMIAETPEWCGCFSNRISLKHVRKERSIDWCDPPKQDFRKYPSACFNETKLKGEEKQACGAGHSIKPSAVVTGTLITIVLIYSMFG